MLNCGGERPGRVSDCVQVRVQVGARQSALAAGGHEVSRLGQKEVKSEEW